MKKTLQELNLSDDFMFSKVMSDEEICKPFLEKILGIEIGNFHIVGSENSVKIHYDKKGVRFDILAEEKTDASDAEKEEIKSIFEMEVQNLSNKSRESINVPNRTRIYRASVDSKILEEGKGYEKLPNLYIIFICTFDYFKKGIPIYTFTNTCKEIPDLEFGDGVTNIVINTKHLVEQYETTGNIDNEMKVLLEYIGNSTKEVADKADSELIHKIHEKVEKVKSNRNCEVELMTFGEKLEIEYGEGYDDGYDTGYGAGTLDGEKRGISIGKEQNIFLMKRISSLKKEGYSLAEIASQCEITEDEIKEMYNLL